MKLNELLLPFDKIWPVGSYYDTSNADFNPNTEWGGTWIREDDGTALVSYKSSGKFNEPIGTIVGEETHTLTKTELPQIDIKTNYASSSGGDGSGLVYGSRVGDSNNQLVQNINYGNQAHNNVQPSTIVYRWHRTS